MTDGDVTFLGRNVHLTVIGDSNTIIFDGLTFRHAARPGTTFTFRSTYLREASMGDLGDDAGATPLFREGLLQAMMLDPNATDRVNRRRDFTAARDALPDGTYRDDEVPVLVVCGNGDYTRVLHRFGPGVDFALPDVRHGPSPIDIVGTVYPVPAALVEEMLAPSLAAYERALAFLVEAGVRAYVLGLRPPSMDDDEMDRRWFVRSRAHFRDKVTLLLNDRLATLCERVGARFIDTWPLYAVDGVFDERLELDHVHVNREAARRVAVALLDDFFGPAASRP